MAGNTIVLKLKPNEKVTLTMFKVMELFEQAGFPKGIVKMANGTEDVVTSLIDH